MTELELNHCLFTSTTLYFVGQRPLTRERYDELCRILASKASASSPADIHSAEAIDRHWQGLEERMAGNARWDKVCPLPANFDVMSKVFSLFNLNNILKKRPYIAFEAEGVRYLIEVFNPKGELEVAYAGAGEPVAALVIGQSPAALGRPIGLGDYSGLANKKSFNAILREFDAVLDCERICGIHSLNLVFSAYRSGLIPLSERPWDRLFDLDVRKLPNTVDRSQLGQHFQQVEEWPDGRIQLQVQGGMSTKLGSEYSEAAKAVGTTHYKDLHRDNI